MGRRLVGVVSIDELFKQLLVGSEINPETNTQAFAARCSSICQHLQ